MGASRSVAVVAGLGAASLLVIAFALHMAFLGSHGCGAEHPPRPEMNPAPPAPEPRSAHAGEPTAGTTRHTRGAASDGAEPATGSTVVRVVSSEDGAPIPGAWVVASFGRSAALVTLRADASGSVRFEGLADGEWRFRASPPGWLAREVTTTVRSGAAGDISIRVTPAASLVVRTLDAASGEPVPDVGLTIHVPGTAWSETGKTGDDGERLFSVPAGSPARLVADDKEHAEATQTLRIGPAGSVVAAQVRLVRFVAATGTVVAPDGSAVADATVWFQRTDAPMDPTFTVFGKSGPDGRFSAQRLVPGWTYSGFAMHGNRWAPATAAVHPADSDVAVDFRLGAFGKLVVRVRDADGTPVHGVEIAGVRDSQPVPMHDQPGSFEFAAVPPGPLDLVIGSAGFAGATPQHVEIAPGGTTAVDVVLARPERVTWTVVDDVGSPVSGAVFHARTQIGGIGFSSRATTDAAGHVDIETPAGSVQFIDVIAPRHETATRETRSGDVDRVIVLERRAMLTFRLVDATGALDRAAAAIVRNGEVTVVLPSPNPATPMSVELTPGGDCDVVVIPQHRPASLHRVALRPGAVTDLGEIRSAAARTVRGRVVDPDGRPVAGARVASWTSLRVLKPSAPSSTDPSASPNDIVSVTDDDGAFDVAFAPASGPLPLVVEADGFARLVQAFEVPLSATVEITLPRGALVWGEVVTPEGAPVGQLSVRLVAEGSDRFTGIGGPGGTFEARVPAGRYTLRASGCDDVTVELREGADEHVRLVTRSR